MKKIWGYILAIGSALVGLILYKDHQNDILEAENRLNELKVEDGKLEVLQGVEADKIDELNADIEALEGDLLDDVDTLDGAGVEDYWNNND